jgi:hypothetical protein
MLSNLNVSGNIELNGNMTIGSILDSSLDIKTNLIVLSEMISQLPNYKNNAEASLNGIPLWGFYRTGGILKIRLDDTPPQLSLVGNNIINLLHGNMYIEPGVNAIDNVDDQLIPDLISILDNNMNSYLNNPISISGPTNITSTLNLGQYTLTYKAIDNAGNSATITRILNVL